MSDELIVPMWGTGELIDLSPAPAAIKAATDEELGAWYALHFKPVKDTFGLVKEELIGRMEKRGQTLLPLENGQTVECKKNPKRSCTEAGLAGLREIEKRINEEHGIAISLVRVKIEAKPDMRGVAKAKKLGDEFAEMIDINIEEDPGYPSLKVTGMTEAQREKILHG